MSFPATAKTWQFQVNQTVVLQSSAENQAKLNLLTIKNLMKSFGSNPWTVYFSCTASGSGTAGTAGDGVDRWATIADLLSANGTKHSWIVLKQAAIGGAAGFQVCIDNTGASGISLSSTIAISFGAGFTGGTISARPTATDEVVLISNAQWASGALAQHQIHAMMSTDGTVTRICMWRGGTNLCTYWEFGKVQNPVSGWSNTAYGQAYGATSGYANSYGNLQGQNVHCTGNGGTPLFAAGFTYETYNGNAGGLPQVTGIGSSANTFDGQWPVLPMGLAAAATGNAGRLGNIYDLWWRPSGINDADTFPNNAATRQFCAMGNLIFPWVGDSTVALLA
jgi:hypothetical protein